MTVVSQEVGAAVQTVYGDDAFARFSRLAASNLLENEAEVVSTFQQTPFPPVERSPFDLKFDNQNLVMRTWGHPERFPTDRPIRIVQFGARPETTWPLVSALAIGHAPDMPSWPVWNDHPGLQFTLQACVEDPRVREHFANPQWDRAYDWSLGGGGKPRREGFVLGRGPNNRSTYITPSDELQARVTVTDHNLIDGPLPVEEGDEADIVVAYDQLWRYPVNTREHLLARMLRTVREGGLFVTDGWNGNNQTAPGYPDWPRDLGRVGLIRLFGADGYDLLDFNPFGLRERPPQVSPAVTEAIGVLSAAKQQAGVERP